MKDLFLARVVGNVVSTVKHPAYHGKKILILDLIDNEGNSTGDYQIGVDYVGAGPGDLVIAGGPPGAAREVFNIKFAPIKVLVMGIVDKYYIGEDEYPS